MLPGFDNVDIRHGELRKTALIDEELQKLQMDIVALQETRIAGSGCLREANFTFYWRGLEADQPRWHGVGFAVKNTLLQSITSPVGISERLMLMRLNTAGGYVNLINAYAPTLAASMELKDSFYGMLGQAFSSIPHGEQLYLLGDFNARVGRDHDTWPTSLGHFGVGKMNENGQRLLEFCSERDLVITNTMFGVKECRRVSWCHPRSKHWHQLDLVITRKQHLNNVKVTRSFHSADCDSDHSLVASRVEVTHKRIHRRRPEARPRVNAKVARQPESKEIFSREFSRRMQGCAAGGTVDQVWHTLSKSIYDSAVASCGVKRHEGKDWVEAYAGLLMPLLDAKKSAMLEHKTNPSQATLDRLRHARSEAQREARRCANQYWTELCTSIQTASDVGDAGTMYSLMKVALGPRVSKTAPLKTKEGEAITDKTKQLDRWVEHYSELYSKEIAEKPRLEEVLPAYPELAELDAMPEESELLEALSALPSGKAPGQDGIPAEVLKENREVILPYLYELLRQCWEEGKVPNEMCNAKIVTLYKNKGDRGDCNNFRGISLLSITGKAIARIVRKRLQTLAERVLPESQCGFRAGRSTTDMIFTLRQLQEKCREQCMPLYIAFVDLTKAFDTVCRPALYKVLKSVGCPPKLLKLVISFHEDMKACVQFDGATSDFFDIKNGVKQGCVMAPTLFSIYFAVLLRYAFKGNQDGVYIRSRTDGSLFNLARLRARSKTVESLCRELLFADDAALTAHKESALQGLLDSLARACDLFALPSASRKRSEAWTVYSRQEKRLNSFHLRCLRKILNIKWQDKITNELVLQQAGSLSLFEILRRNRLRWLGHVARMDDNRLPKKILYGELSQGSRPRGRPKLRFKDLCKATLQDFSIESWEKAASDRSKWRAAIHKGTELFKAARESRKAEARSRRKGPVEKSTTREYCCRFCGRACRARIGCTSHERRCPARPAESD
ncbi:hypothetical protein Bbelb_270890 [Branchiostoma belcheri]|nr:hypothetical protein Bbelb_270890 [Branchiostoma belcheri]